jgi:hypothetical protein
MSFVKIFYYLFFALFIFALAMGILNNTDSTRLKIISSGITFLVFRCYYFDTKQLTREDLNL